MKLNEVANTAVKVGLILRAAERRIDAEDWHGSTEVFLNKTAFQNRVVQLFSDFADLAPDGLSYDKLDDHPAWDDFIEGIWIDDRF